MSTQQRMQLARELHDGVAQDLVALGYELDLLLATVDLQSPTRKGIRSLRFRVDELISKVRREMYQLREANDESVQEKICKAAREICGDRQLRFLITNFAIEPNLGLEITAMASELLRNSVRHSRGSEI